MLSDCVHRAKEIYPSELLLLFAWTLYGIRLHVIIEAGNKKLEEERQSVQQQLMLPKDEIAIWTWLVSRGIAKSLSGLSEMVGVELSVTSLDLRQYPAKDAAMLLGGPENLVVGIYLTIDGDATGHIMLIHDRKIAFELIDIQMELPLGSTQELEEMGRSILGEMGNIIGSFFLNALANATSLNLTPSPPLVMINKAEAILGIVLNKIMQEQDDVLVIKAAFGTDSRQIDGTFMVLPTSDFMQVILKHPKTQSVRSQYHLHALSKNKTK